MTIDGMHVLVVDDVAAIRENVGRMLALAPHVGRVSYAADGAAAVTAVAADTPDVAILDIRMPVLDGIAAAREIRDRWPGVAIVFHSAYEDESMVAEATDIGAEAYVVKGSPVRDLFGHVSDAAAAAALRVSRTPQMGGN